MIRGHDNLVAEILDRKKNHSWVWIARQCEVTPTTLRRFVEGKGARGPFLQTAVKISKAMGMELAYVPIVQAEQKVYKVQTKPPVRKELEAITNSLIRSQNRRKAV